MGLYEVLALFCVFVGFWDVDYVSKLHMLQGRRFVAFRALPIQP